MEAARGQVLDIAELAFAELGYQQANLRLIAERCEFAVGTLYSLFADKDALFQAVLERRGRLFFPAMEQTAASGIAPDEKLLRLAETQVGFYQQYPHWARIMTSFIAPGSRATLPGGYVADRYEESYRQAMRLQAAVIAEGQRKGVIRKGDPEALARIFSALVSAHHVIEDEAARVPMSLSIEELCSVIRAAFAPPQGG